MNTFILLIEGLPTECLTVFWSSTDFQPSWVDWALLFVASWWIAEVNWYRYWKDFKSKYSRFAFWLKRAYWNDATTTHTKVHDFSALNHSYKNLTELEWPNLLNFTVTIDNVIKIWHRFLDLVSLTTSAGENKSLGQILPLLFMLTEQWCSGCMIFVFIMLEFLFKPLSPSILNMQACNFHIRTCYAIAQIRLQGILLL